MYAFEFKFGDLILSISISRHSWQVGLKIRAALKNFYAAGNLQILVKQNGMICTIKSIIYTDVLFHNVILMQKLAPNFTPSTCTLIFNPSFLVKNFNQNKFFFLFFFVCNNYAFYVFC